MNFDLPDLHGRLRAHAPLVQNITNTVVKQFSANVLLAMGASPAMIDHEADSAQFAQIADSILINFGTATNQQLLAADAAIAVAQKTKKPWVMDPVSVGVVDFRTIKIRQAVAQNPTVVRGNASEIMALADMGAGGRGVDSADETESALPAAISLAKSTKNTVAVSGVQDAIVAVIDGEIHIAHISGGHKLMSLVIGTGCSLGSATAAYLAVRENNDAKSTFEAAIAAHAHFALAGSAAAVRASSPGSFAVAFLDALFELTSDDMARAGVKIETRSL